MLAFAHVTEIGVSSMSATNLDPVWLNSEPAQMDKSGSRAQRPQVLRTDKAGQPGCVDLRAHSPSQGQVQEKQDSGPSLSSWPTAGKVVSCQGHLRSRHGGGKPSNHCRGQPSLINPLQGQGPSFLDSQALYLPGLSLRFCPQPH